MRLVRDGDRGETLVEILVAVAILGIGAVAVLAAFEFSVKASALGRNQSTSNAYVRNVAEAIQNYVAAGNYKSCAAASAYTGTSPSSTSGGLDYYTTYASFTLPQGYAISQPAATVWNGTSFSSACTPSTDYGLQKLVLTVTSTGSGVHQAAENLTVIVRKPCSAGGYSAASPC